MSLEVVNLFSSELVLFSIYSVLETPILSKLAKTGLASEVVREEKNINRF